jgi:F-type H+-transporting ATPase subunit epsilon
MKLQILALDGTKYDGEAVQVSLPTTDGEITVLKNHIPLITTLKAGHIKFTGNNIAISGGFAEISRDKVVVLAN